ncbi:MAG: response regulator [Inquilinus sp.]|nr:response regulator [Inquilinus sp.]
MPNLGSLLWIVLTGSVALNLAVTLVLWRRWARGRAIADDGRTVEQRHGMTLDALETLPLGFSLYDRDARLVLCNESYRRANAATADLLVPGAARADLVQATAERGAIPEGADPRVWVAAELARSLAEDIPFDRQLADKRWYRINEHRTVGGGMVRLLTDITERKQHEAARQHTQKIEAIGQLAGGLAHEFNNILTAVGGFSELAQRRLQQPKFDRQRVSKLLDEVIAGVRRAGILTRQILTFSRHQTVETKVVDATASIRGIEDILRSLAADGIEVELAFDSDAAMVEVDPSQMEQAVINLALNARDAMPNGGAMSIACRTVELDRAFVAAHKGRRPGRHAAVSVSDTGNGMDAATASRAFEPFFTTKKDGRGTGLGLSIVYGFARQAGGMVTVESLPGKGSVFTVFLPIAGRMESQAEPPPADGGRVLVVDDEQTVRDFVTLALEELGYEVHAVATGEDALRFLDGHAGEVDVLLTDVMMPGLTGPDLAGQAAKRHPSLAVVYMSGYENRRLAKERMLAKGDICLYKPFTQVSLDQAVRRALADGRAPPEPALATPVPRRRAGGQH